MTVHATRTTTGTRYITPADTAKLLRKALRVAFPAVKFSVRTHTYSGGASVDVRWMDGPSTARVEAVAKAFAGATFNGSDDSMNYHPAMVDGELVRFGADFVNCTRDYSAAFTQRLVDIVARVTCLEAPPVRTFRGDDGPAHPDWNHPTTRRHIGAHDFGSWVRVLGEDRNGLAQLEG